MKVIFTGDLMLGGDFLNEKISEKNFDDLLFKKIKSSDYLINNFENVIGKSKNLRRDKDCLLYCSQKTFYSYINIFPNSVFCLGNNHVNDFGNIVFLKTRKLLEANNIKNYGAGYIKDAKKPLIIEEKIILINFSTDDSFVNSKIAKKDKIGCISYDLDEIKKIIKKIDLNEKFLIITLHWGYEGVILPSPTQIEFAHKLIDLGADLVIGHHPHIMQPHEIYKGKYIFYSLGNFFFPNFYGFKTGIYYEWNNFNNRSIIIQLEISDNYKFDINIIGIKFIPERFLLIEDRISKRAFYTISNIFKKAKNNDLYEEQFNKSLKNNYNYNMSSLLILTMNFLTIFSPFKKNKYPFVYRIRKILKLRKLKFLIKVFSNYRNWLRYNPQLLINQYNFLFNFAA